MKKLTKYALLLAAMVMGFAFTSCQHETSSTEPTLYTVTVSSSIEHGKVTVDKTSAIAGATITLTATADEGYKLDSYSVTDSSANAIPVTNGTFTMPASNVTVSATFAEIPPTVYTITVVSVIKNGSVNVNKTSAEAGTTITLTATADDGYELESYSVQDASANAITVTNSTFIMPESNVTVSATFVPTYSVTITDCANGSVTANKTSAIAGATITLTATADDGYELESYSVQDASANAITVTNSTFIMPESNVTVSAAFKVVYIGTKAPDVAKEVGDIVFNDGSAMPYADFTALTDDEKNAKKTSAIALIFYKGTDLNSDTFTVNDNNYMTVTTSDTTTVRTLGVGLKHIRSKPWCTSSANAYNENIKTIQCCESGDAGALTFRGDKNGSDNLEQIEAFDGVDDTATADNYPAFYFAKNYKEQKIGSETVSRISAESEFETGWYLPSIAELFQIYACCKDVTNGFDIDAASQALGGDKFGNAYYWSSSQDNGIGFTNKILQLKFDDGTFFPCNKDDNGDYWCTIRAFN